MRPAAAMGIAIGALGVWLGCAREAAAPRPRISAPPIVTVTVYPTKVMPGDTIFSSVTATPRGADSLGRVVIRLSGVLTAVESLKVGSPGTFATRRIYHMRRDTLGQLTITATGWVGDSSASGDGQVLVADNTPPSIGTFYQSPLGSTIQPGDALSVLLSGMDPIGVRYTIIQFSGALTLADTMVHAYTTGAMQTLAMRVPPTVTLGQSYVVTGSIVDGVGLRTSASQGPITIVDNTPPSVSASALNQRGTLGFSPGDTMFLTLWAHDNYRLTRVGYSLTGPVNRADSFPASDTVFAKTDTIPITSAWLGTTSVAAFALDSAGNRTALASGDIVVANRTTHPMVTATLPARARDVAFDAKRGVIYVSEPDSDQVGVLYAATGAWAAPLTFASPPHGLDQSLSGDSLFVALRTTDYLAVVNLTTGVRDTLPVSIGPGPETVRTMANGKLIVSELTYSNGGTVEVDPVTRVRRYLSGAAPTTAIGVSGDRSRLIVVTGYCCAIQAFIYDAASDSVVLTRGTVMGGWSWASSDYAGGHFLIDSTAFDGALNLIAAVTPAGYGSDGPSVIGSSGADGFFATSTGVAEVDLESGQVVQTFPLAAVPYLLALSPDGLTLAAATPGQLYVIDLW